MGIIGTPHEMRNTTDNIKGILLIHGYTGEPSSMEYLFNYFKNKGYNIELPLLPGHGTTWTDMEKVNWVEWRDKVEDSYNLLRNRTKEIFVCGLSMGGALAINLASNHPEIKGLILINHIYNYSEPGLALTPILKFFIRRIGALGGDIKDPASHESAYDCNPLHSAAELKKLIDVNKKIIHKIRQPVLMFKSSEDHVIPIKSTISTFKNVRSEHKEMIILKNSYHVATLDYDKDIITVKMDKFIDYICEDR